MATAPMLPLRTVVCMAHIKSFGELGGGGDSSDEGDDGMNDYYAGGEKSGQLIRGDPKNKKDEGDKVASLFDRARQSGAVDGTEADLDTSGPFRGTARTVAGGTSQASGPTNHIITFYRNGIFTVSDGPPRRVDDPANFKFIESISRGECPEELEADNPGTPITVNLVRKEEDYEPPAKPRVAAFQGTGRTLGSDSAGASSSSAAVPIPSSLEGEWRGVNESAPTTSLQLRLSDGSRMVARFNHTHKITDIRRFIRASRPDMTGSYQLMTGFPSAVLENEDRTLEEAGLLNAVIIQKKL